MGTGPPNDQMPMIKPMMAPMARLLHPTAMLTATLVSELDASGRVLLPTVLRAYAQLEKDVVMIGQGNKFEVWNKDLWESKREQWLAEEAAKTDGLPDEMKTFSL